MRTLIAALACLSLALLPGSALGAPDTPHLAWGSQVNPAQCPTDQDYRYLEINVTHGVKNDADSGIAGNYWAADDYNKHIQVWKIGTAGEEEVFCAVVRYQGAFTTVAGASPGNSDVIAAGIEGTFQGGYRAIIVRHESPSPVYKRRGNIGVFDYGWTGIGAPTPFDWLGVYFATVTLFSFEWWGWVYHGGPNGTWVNSSDGNQGDITD